VSHGFSNHQAVGVIVPDAVMQEIEPGAEMEIRQNCAPVRAGVWSYPHSID
jgi:hypothetical protein